jgi:NhaC family Na+:H+ antiporter
VGALAGTWLVSGIIPAMVYYGLQVLSPGIFLPASVIIAAVISVATGSSWTTSATVGIALVGIGTALGIPTGMIAGAVVSGAYFGDKMSPLSDTTNLAPAMAGTDLFTHIRYMTITTVPSIMITIVVFGIISLNIDTTGTADISGLLNTIKTTFNITPYLFIVPVAVIGLILLKIKPLISLGIGVVLAAVFAFIFQPEILASLASSNFRAIVNAIFVDTEIVTDNIKLNELFSAGGMKGMLWTIFLICCAMVFGGTMDAIGALAKITKELLKLASSIFGLFFSTVVSCIGLNAIASDQYLAIVIPGKMFKKAFEDKELAPENLSRTLEDSGTVTSVLIPWNTCGAYQSGVLGVSVADYAIYAIFNWLSPIMTLIFAGFRIKIKQLVTKKV